MKRMGLTIGFTTWIALFTVLCCVPPDGTARTDDRRETDVDTQTDTDTSLSAPFLRTAGFINLPPREIGYFETDGQRKAGAADEANIFYTLVPSDTDPLQMPLMVMLNGGPSATTAGHLFAYGTGPYYLDRNDPARLVKENPSSFSAVANLLYIDTRQTGFSYESAIPPREVTTLQEFSASIAFNAFTDVSDILLTLLAVLEKYPALMSNPIVFCGESYGGARVALMLGLLHDVPSLFNPSADYYDPELGTALNEHFARVMPDRPVEYLTWSDISKQFGWQVLLQPGWMLPNREDFTLNARCDDMPSSDPRFALCAGPKGMYDLRFPNEELDEMGIVAGNTFLHPPTFELFFGVAPETIEGFLSSNRQRSYRIVPIYRLGIPSTDWTAKLGALGAKDYFYTPIISGPSNGVSDAYLSRAFMTGLARTHTFITYGYYDFAVSSDKIPKALLNADAFLPDPLVASAVFDPTLPRDATRPGQMSVVFTEAMGLGAGAEVKIRMPVYYDSGHMIPLRQAGDLREDIRDFLEETGAYSSR